MLPAAVILNLVEAEKAMGAEASMVLIPQIQAFSVIFTLNLIITSAEHNLKLWLFNSSYYTSSHSCAVKYNHYSSVNPQYLQYHCHIFHDIREIFVVTVDIAVITSLSSSHPSDNHNNHRHHHHHCEKN